MNTSEYIDYKFEVTNLTLNITNDGSLNSTNSSCDSSVCLSSVNCSTSSDSSSSCLHNTNTTCNSYTDCSITASSSITSQTTCIACSFETEKIKKKFKKKNNQLNQLKLELNQLISNLKNDLNLNFTQLNYEQALLNAKLSTIQCYLKV